MKEAFKLKKEAFQLMITESSPDSSSAEQMRGCVDLFTLEQWISSSVCSLHIFEGVWEYAKSVCMFFVDLEKACDHVPQQFVVGVIWVSSS